MFIYRCSGKHQPECVDLELRRELVVPSAELQEQLVTYLTDVHSLEQNAVGMLQAGAEHVGDQELMQAFREHLVETKEHERLIEGCLERYGASTSTLKDVAQKGSAMISGMMARSADDTTGKFAIQAFAFEHVEIASYRMLCVVAERADDHDTLDIARRILEQEQQAAAKLNELIEEVAEFDLGQMGLAA